MSGLSDAGANDRATLLKVFLSVDPSSVWSDLAVATMSGLTERPHACWWKRLGELRELGLIEWVRSADGKRVQMSGVTGRPVGISRVTELGLSAQAMSICHGATASQLKRKQQPSAEPEVIVKREPAPPCPLELSTVMDMVKSVGSDYVFGQTRVFHDFLNMLEESLEEIVADGGPR